MNLWMPALTLSLCLVAIPEAGAEDCGPVDCDFTDHWVSFEPINTALIPIDGVLLLQGDNRYYGGEWATQISIEVTLAGQPVAGALEETTLGQLFAWRPAQPFEPGATYKVTGLVDNSADGEVCSPDIALDFEFETDVGSMAPLTAPEVVADETLVITPERSLETLVCCEGAIPMTVFGGCGEGVSISLEYPDGACAPKSGFATLGVLLDITPQPEVATAGQLMYELIVDGVPANRGTTTQLGWGSFEEFCTEVRATNLANGETVTTPMQCHGAALVDQVGAVDIDASLEITCTEPLQTCEVDGPNNAWDPNKCTPWPPGEPEAPTTGEPTESGSEGGSESGSEGGSEGSSGGSAGEDDLVGKGCACDGGDAGGSGLLGVLGLLGLGLAPRRRSAGVRAR